MINHRTSLNEGTMDNFSNYMGKVIPDNFLILMSRSRDSDILSESNWDCALKTLGGESESVRIDRFGHWACGWYELLSVDENSPQIHTAVELEAAIENYPVLDESDFSERESEEANQVWAFNFNDHDRIDYIRKYREQFEFQSFRDLLSCARGEWFQGWASELLS
jgi:hypothetical protein